MVEWSITAACRAVGRRVYGGSNPSASTEGETKVKKKPTQKQIEQELENQHPGFKVQYAPGAKESMAKLGFESDYEPSKFQEFRWMLERLWEWPSDRKADIVAFIQRGKRGYADRDCWGLDDYLCDWLPSALRTMVDKNKGGGNSYPGEPWGPEAENFKTWKATVHKMAKGFEAHKKLSDLMYHKDKAKMKELQKEHEEGMVLFVKFFGHLWD